MTKHEQILKHIESLAIGSKISVRKIAKDLAVSEGTAYRAIKDAGQIGLVTTIDRVGTVRIEKRNRDEIDNLTFNEIANIVEGQIIAGKNGVNKTVSNFAIGAMELSDILRYIGPQTLLIIGNRRNVQLEVLKRGTAILITGGFQPTKEVIQYADEHDLPVLSSSYDTFLVANIINRAMFNQKIRKEILVVEDIVKPINELSVLLNTMTLDDYKQIANETGHTRFPVVNKDYKLVGIVTSREIINMSDNDMIEDVMTKHPISVKLSNTVASCAHLLIWEGIELLPVTDNNKKAVGVINRQDVLKSMQLLGRQTDVSPLLTNHYGTLSKAVFVGIIEETLRHEMRKYKKGNVMIESLNIIYLKTVPIETGIDVKYEMLDVGRYFAKLEVTMYCQNEKVAIASVICQMFEGY